SCLVPTPTLLVLFSFYRSGHPPALHSFPTRRSSDLLLRLSHQRNTILMHSFFTIGPAVRYIYLATKVFKLFNHINYAGIPQIGADRKSTRLNSSHVKISYAVFCLKKKKKYKVSNQ